MTSCIKSTDTPPNFATEPQVLKQHFLIVESEITFSSICLTKN